MYFHSNKPRSFGGKSFSNYKEEQIVHLKNEIENQDKSYILNVNEDDYKTYLFDKYKLVPLEVNFKLEDIATPKNIKIIKNERREDFEVNGYEINISYPYSGSSILFQLAPTTRTLTGYEIVVGSNTVSLTVRIDNRDAEHFKKEKEQAVKSAFTNLDNINKDVINWNNSLESKIANLFSERKSNCLSENSFFEAIKVKVDERTKSTFVAPVIKKIIIPQPKSGKINYSQNPSLDIETYEDTLDVIYNQGRSMERKPSTYKGRNEEDIRDYLITLLETRYESTTVGGETFNKGGKTDILIKYEDGSNLFVGECKWWKGESELKSAINQLFDNYLTWRDSKTALIFFVKNKDISNVCEKIKTEAQNHDYFKSYINSKGDGRFSFKFHFPSDINKEVYLEVMAFHFMEH